MDARRLPPPPPGYPLTGGAFGAARARAGHVQGCDGRGSTARRRRRWRWRRPPTSLPRARRPSPWAPPRLGAAAGGIAARSGHGAGCGGRGPSRQPEQTTQHVDGEPHAGGLQVGNAPQELADVRRSRGGPPRMARWQREVNAATSASSAPRFTAPFPAATTWAPSALGRQHSASADGLGPVAASHASASAHLLLLQLGVARRLVVHHVAQQIRGERNTLAPNNRGCRNTRFSAAHSVPSSRPATRQAGPGELLRQRAHRALTGAWSSQVRGRGLFSEGLSGTA